MFIRAMVLILALTGGLSAAQFPAFSQQYLQRLGGAVDALAQVAADFDASAAKLGMSRAAALEEMRGTAFIESRQKDMRLTFARLDRLQADLAALQGHGPFMRAYQVAHIKDREIVRRTWQAFEPGLPLSRASLVFALTGAVAVMIVLSLAGKCCHRAQPAGHCPLDALSAKSQVARTKISGLLMARTPPPFAAFEWMIAWRYLRARRAEGGVSVMTWISLLGITLAVFALIATLAVRSGFRAEFVGTILGANAHVTIYAATVNQQTGQIDRAMRDYEAQAQRVAQIPGVTRVAPLVRGQVLGAYQGRNVGMEIYGIAPEDLMTLPGISAAEQSVGDITRFTQGIALGSGVARELGAGIGDQVRIISPDGVKTAFGTSPRINAYEVTYIFSAGRYDIDRTRAYLPFGEAQAYFNREGFADELEVMVEDPENIGRLEPALLQAAGERGQIWTWKDASGGFLRALEVEDNVMFIILSILVLIAAMNIVSGLIMLVKNKGRDIGILRTMGLSEGSVLRIFFICGATTGVLGTIAGVVLGSLFALYIDPIFSFVNVMMGGGVWDPSIRGIYALPAELHLRDVLSAVALSIGLSFVVTIFPARRAARMNPVEALRYE